LIIVENTIYDSDKDNILDDVDSCLTLPETYNNFEDTDGCPDIVPKIYSNSMLF